MQTSIVFLALLGLTLAGAVPKGSEFDFEHFKVKFGRSYENKNEEIYRKSIFDKSVEEIKKHNRLYISGLASYSLEVNHLSDKLISEVIGNGIDLDDFIMEDESNFDANFTESVPYEVDWRERQGVVQAVKDQGRCLSGWAFSTIGSLEGQMMLKQHKSVSLSEAQLMDCDISKENHYCYGGKMKPAFDYIEKTGVESDDDYIYVPKKRPCKYDKSKVVARISGSKRLIGNEETLTKAIATVGPISIIVIASNHFILYGGGILDDHSCLKFRYNLHPVLAVGYGSDGPGQDYYIVKNSFGPWWGEFGFIRMSRNKANQCGVANYMVYPIVDEA